MANDVTKTSQITTVDNYNKYPEDFVDSNHVSELHYTYLIGEWNET